MFEWYWIFLFILGWVHIVSTAHSIYLHRTVGHNYLIIKKPLEYVLRFILWLEGRLGPRYAETYTSRHLKHHATSDSVNDPHSPYYMSVSEMSRHWYVDDADVKKYCPRTTTPDDWMQRTLHEKYRTLGPILLCLIAGLLFGLNGFLIMVLFESHGTYLSLLFGNWMLHRVGFTYAGNKGTDRSKNLFPVTFFLGGEELHANHHNRPKSPKFSQRWFEFDIGWMYIKIFAMFKLLKIKE